MCNEGMGQDAGQHGKQRGERLILGAMAPDGGVSRNLLTVWTTPYGILPLL
jgi:hypothetical protein